MDLKGHQLYARQLLVHHFFVSLPVSRIPLRSDAAADGGLESAVRSVLGELVKTRAHLRTRASLKQEHSQAALALSGRELAAPALLWHLWMDSSVALLALLVQLPRKGVDMKMVLSSSLVSASEFCASLVKDLLVIARTFADKVRKRVSFEIGCWKAMLLICRRKVSFARLAALFCFGFSVHAAKFSCKERTRCRFLRA